MCSGLYIGMRKMYIGQYTDVTEMQRRNPRHRGVGGSGAHRGPGICRMGGVAVLAAVLVSAQGVSARILGRMPTILVSSSSCPASRHGRQRYLRPGSGLRLHATCLMDTSQSPDIKLLGQSLIVQSCKRYT